jgi:putative transposase
MPYRKVIFYPGENYHLINHGVGEEDVFLEKADYVNFINRVNFYRFPSQMRFSYYQRLSLEDKELFFNNLLLNNKPLVSILTFSLLPNHFHFIVEEISFGGIKAFMSNLQNSYVRYFNTKYKRRGPLFQSVFFAVHITSDDQLMFLSGYVHSNPYAAFLAKSKDELFGYSWSSLPDYVSQKQSCSFLNKKPIMSFFSSREEYKDYVQGEADYHRQQGQLKKEEKELEG